MSKGRTCRSWVDHRGAGLEYAQAADFIRQAAKGLLHAHENGLIHRDIKPANLLVDQSECLKILDLGLARFFDDSDEEASLTQSHGESTLGTADYLSPEQALNSHDIDTRSDIYSLGCTMYFLLTGSAPFPEGTVAQRLMAHQAKAPKPIERFRPDVPADLIAIIDRMIAKQPDDRFQTMEEIAGSAERLARCPCGRPMEAAASRRRGRQSLGHSRSHAGAVQRFAGTRKSSWDLRRIPRTNNRPPRRFRRRRTLRWSSRRRRRRRPSRLRRSSCQRWILRRADLLEELDDLDSSSSSNVDLLSDALAAPQPAPSLASKSSVDVEALAIGREEPPVLGWSDWGSEHRVAGV